MCGIVGLFLKNKALEPELGAMMAGMLGTMCERGPDSAGFAVYGAGDGEHVKLTARAPAPNYNFASLAGEVADAIGGEVDVAVHNTHAVFTVPAASEQAARDAIETLGDRVKVVGSGTRMEIYKEVGRPDRVAKRFDLPHMAGSHGIGHTRMATESAVTTDGAHPFSTGRDQCLVHNGSLSNHNGIRRKLIRKGLKFETENDTEVAAAYLTWRMSEGATLGEALESSLDDLDGFYTFVVGTESGFGVLRDPIACKHAVLAETDDYVAFGTEYRALAGLPGIETARIWEAEPATVYFWGAGLMPLVDLEVTSLRSLNQRLHGLEEGTNDSYFRIANPRGRHSVAVGLDQPVTVEIDGNVGYYCAAMNQHATVIVNGSAGVGLAENMMSGRIHVKGDASASAGATGCGGLLIIDGNAAGRCGISARGVDIVVKGSVGHMSAFMAQAGSLVVLGDAGEALGDSIYEAHLFVRGEVRSLGADCIEKPMSDKHKHKLGKLLAEAGVNGEIDPGEFRRYGSARKLYHFHIDNLGAY